MGTSAKGILLSGIYCMLGLYNFSFTASDEAARKTAIAVVDSKKVERLSNSAVALALSYMGKNQNNKNLYKVKTVGDCSVTYSVTSKGWRKAEIKSVAVNDRREVTTIISLEFDSKKFWGSNKEWGGWRVTDKVTKSALKKTKK